MFLIVVILLFVITHNPVVAQDNTSYPMKDYVVYYNVFNSTLIAPDIAKTYKLTRAKDRAYLNVALVKKTGGNGIPAIIKAQHRNLMQQRFELEFVEIKEANATYYLAPIRFNHEEILHIDLFVESVDQSESAQFTITKKLYRD